MTMFWLMLRDPEDVDHGGGSAMDEFFRLILVSIFVIRAEVSLLVLCVLLIVVLLILFLCL